ATNCKLPRPPPEQLGAELAGSAERIEALGLPRPRALSYPYGEWTPEIADAVRDSGYRAGFTVEWGIVGEGSNPFALPRVEVHRSDTPRKLRRKLALAGAPGLLRDGLLTLTGVRLDPSGG
ncbi:MAG TPA: polysaccharide deacetylase family protein, partial [Solirubrobacterales bacterium]